MDADEAQVRALLLENNLSKFEPEGVPQVGETWQVHTKTRTVVHGVSNMVVQRGDDGELCFADKYWGIPIDSPFVTRAVRLAPNLLWCVNDKPHAPHRERNSVFDSWNECSGRPEPKQASVPSTVQVLIEVHDSIAQIVQSQYNAGRYDAAFGANQARETVAARIITESKGTIRMNPTGGTAP